MKRSRKIELQALREQNRRLHNALSSWALNSGPVGTIPLDVAVEEPEPLTEYQLRRLTSCQQFLCEVDLGIIEGILRLGFRLTDASIRSILIEIQNESDNISRPQVSRPANPSTPSPS